MKMKMGEMVLNMMLNMKVEEMVLKMKVGDGIEDESWRDDVENSI